MIPSFVFGTLLLSIITCIEFQCSQTQYLDVLIDIFVCFFLCFDN